MDALVNGLSTGLTTVSGDMLDALGTVLPIALTVMGAILVVTIGVKFFKRFGRG